MIEGSVSPDGEAVVPLIVRGFGGEELALEAVIDTGFSGSLGLTQEQVDELHLVPSGSVTSELADGTQQVVTTYFAAVDWDGVQRLVEVIGGDAIPLVGMGLLRGYNLLVDVVDGGSVRITRLP